MGAGIKGLDCRQIQHGQALVCPYFSATAFLVQTPVPV